MSSTDTALTGPAWLAARRAASEGRLAASVIPTAEEEVWRYSPIGELDVTAFRTAVGANARDAIDRCRAHADAVVGDRAGLLVVVDGHVAIFKSKASLDEKRYLPHRPKCKPR